MAQLIIGIFVVFYAVFVAATVYFSLIGAEKAPGSPFLGKLVLWHGRAWIIGAVLTTIIGFSLLFLNVMAQGMGLNLWVGGF